MSTRLACCYCWPTTQDGNHTEMAARFIASYCANPPMVNHETVILTDPGDLLDEFDLARATMPNVSFFQCDAPGRDLSRYFKFAESTDVDICLFFGGSSYFRRPGWGVQVIRSFETLGNTNLYGSCGHTGAGPVRPHVRTTGFWASPKMMRRYPSRPHDHASRYTCEHGQGCLSDWFRAQGHQTWVVSFNGHWPLERANDDPQGYARGAQQAMLFGDKLTMPPFQKTA